MGKKIKKKNSDNEIFNFSDEIVIGINSPKVIEKKKKGKSNIKKVKKTEKKINKSSKVENNKKSNQKLKGFIKWVFLMILLIGAITFFLMSPFFNIKEITIEGENRISAKQIENLSGLNIGQNIFNFSKIRVKENIKTNPYISTVEINRSLPNKISIKVTERIATFMIEIGGAYVYLDNQGYALELSNEKLELPIITSLNIDEVTFRPGDRLNNEDLIKLEQVITIVTAMKSNELYDKLISIDISDTSNYVLQMTDKKTVYLGDTNNLNVKMLYIKKILETEEGIEGTIFLTGSNKEVFFREKI